MFSKVFTNAKRILSRSPSVQNLPDEAQEATPNIHDLDITMVSTRSGADLTPRSDDRKGKRGLEAGDTPISSKKRRKSVGVDDKDKDATVARDNQLDDLLQADIAEAQLMSVKKDKLPIRRRTNPMVVINTPTTRSSSGKAASLASPKEQGGSPTPASSKKKAKKPRVSSADVIEQAESVVIEKAPESTVQVPVPAVTTKTPTTPKSKKKTPNKDVASTPATSVTSASKFPDEIPSSTYESEQAPIPSAKPTPVSTSKASKSPAVPKSTEKASKKIYVSPLDQAPVLDASAKPKKIRFGDEEPPAAPVPMVVDTPEPQEEDDQDSGSDSDEAPEEMTTASAVRQAKALDEEALRAQQALQEKEKLKRKERADRIKQEQGVKQRKAEKKAEKLAKKQAREELLEPQEEELDIDIHNLPALLPNSILEAAGDARPPTPPRQLSGRTEEEARQEKINRHIKFLERGEKPIKDVKKGSLNVHVLAPQNMLLAPKVNRDTRNIRERWLKGRQADKISAKGKKGKMQFKRVERRATGGGFLRGED
jgi:U3 small nucleolar RNA-associated protein 16